MNVVSRGSRYRLAMDVWGVGFKTADRIAEASSAAREIRRDGSKRGSCKRYGMRAIRDISLACRRPSLEEKASQLLEMGGEGAPEEENVGTEGGNRGFDRGSRRSGAKAIDALALGGLCGA